MCSILDFAEDKGRQEGWLEGWQEGWQEVREEVIINALKANFPIVSIIQLGFTEDEVRIVVHKTNFPIDL